MKKTMAISIFSIVFCFFCHFSLDSMFRNQGASGRALKTQLGIQVAFFSLNASDFRENTPNEINPFDKQRDYDEVARIALENIIFLMQPELIRKSNEQDVVHKRIMPSLSGENMKTNVWLINGSPVGFINYYTFVPWYQRLIRFSDSRHAKIQALAVSSLHRGKGIGSKLLSDALEDCKKQNVNLVSLTTTSEDLGAYYSKFGFKFSQYTPAHPRSTVPIAWVYILRTNPSLGSRILQSVLRLIK